MYISRRIKSGSEEKWAMTRNLQTMATMPESLKVKETALRNLMMKAANTENLKENAVALDALPKSLRDSETVADWVIPWKLMRRTLRCLLTTPLPGPLPMELMTEAGQRESLKTPTVMPGAPKGITTKSESLET